MGQDVETIKQRLSVEEVLQEYIKLKRAGQNLKALCPFHNEKTPSFMVNPERENWHCFGCGEGGDIFAFVQKIEGIEFSEALRILANKANVELQKVDPKVASQRVKFLEILEIAAQWFELALSKSKSGEVARDYLKNRELTEDTIKEFRIGFAPDAWEECFNFLQKRGYKAEDIEGTGLAIKSEKKKGHYDRFRNRIMFPIRDLHGQIVGFTARALAEDEPAKYINTPQTMLYNKSLVIYNIDQAKSYIRDAKFAVLTEGQMDVISSWQAGVKNVIAASGTALTVEQCRLIKRFAKKVAVSFDSDAAGIRAAKRGIEVAIKEDLGVVALVLPDGMDPDDAIRKDSKIWIDAIKNALPFTDFLFDKVLEGKDLNNLEDKKVIRIELLEAISVFPDRVSQEHYLEKLAKLVHEPIDDLRSSLPKLVGSNVVASPPLSSEALQHNTKLTREYLLSERILAMVMCDESKISYVINQLKPEMLAFGKPQDLYNLLVVHYTKHQSFDRQKFDLELVDSNPDLRSYSDQLAMFSDLNDENGDEAKAMEDELVILAQSLRRSYLHQQMKELTHKLKTAEEHHLDSEVNEISEKIRQLTQQIRDFG